MAARLLRVRLFAATAALNENRPDREATSRTQATAIVELLKTCHVDDGERESLCQMVSEAGFEARDCSEIMAAIAEGMKAKRRGSQKFCPMLLDAFTQPELDQLMNPNIASATKLSTIFQKLRALGCINLSEMCMKFANSFWCYLQDPVMSPQQLKAMMEYFKIEYKKIMRGYNPQVYLQILPGMPVLKANHPNLYRMAFPGAAPVNAPATLVAKVTSLDATYKCRSAVGLTAPLVQPQQQLQQQQQFDWNSAMQPMQAMMAMMMQAMGAQQMPNPQQAGHVQINMQPLGQKAPKCLKNVQAQSSMRRVSTVDDLKVVCGDAQSSQKALQIEDEDAKDDGQVDGGSNDGEDEQQEDGTDTAPLSIENILDKMDNRKAKPAKAASASATTAAATPVKQPVREAPKSSMKKRRISGKTPAAGKQPETTNWEKAPSWSVERTRSQVLGRTRPEIRKTVCLR